jgi:phosphoribulokinase
MRRVTGLFGGDAKPPKGGNPDSNTLLSDMATVICLDDYHSLDRTGRKVEKVTALDPKAQNFDLMYEQVKALKEGKTVEKPIYNHVTGLLDPAESVSAPKVLIIEGLHPFFDDRVAELCDYKIYLDISDEVKFAWKIQRDMKERGHSLESIKASIEARKPDFDAYIEPQKAKADLTIQVRCISLLLMHMACSCSSLRRLWPCRLLTLLMHGQWTPQLRQSFSLHQPNPSFIILSHTATILKRISSSIPRDK